MGRPKRAADGGLIYHVLNRANARMTIFEKASDYEAFEYVLQEAVERTKTRLLGYCLMPNHWHLVVWRREDGELSRFTPWLTLTHTQRWHAHRGSTGSGHVYQGRFKSFPVRDDDHFYTVCRYVEGNALRAKLVERAEDWRWSSLYRWKHGTAKEKSLLAAWPLPRRAAWVEHVNTPLTEAELSAVRRCVKRGCPQFPTAEHLASWAGLCPGNEDSAGKRFEKGSGSLTPFVHPGIESDFRLGTLTDNTLKHIGIRKIAKGTPDSLVVFDKQISMHLQLICSGVFDDHLRILAFVHAKSNA